MAVRNLLSLILLALPVSTIALADTNVRGVEIQFLETAYPDDGALPDLQFAPSLLSSSPADPALDSTDTVAQAGDAPGDLWQRIRNGYALNELRSPATEKHERWYAARPDYVQRMVGRSQRYLYHIVAEVEKRGMPSEIALLPMVESAFNPKAHSRSGASGIWQFIPSTGRNFGLKQNWWIDNRRDVTAATDAALNYLQKLHVMFGSWDLALAAYNAGEGTVMRAIERNRKRGLPTDYQSLELPDETRNYVPKLMAVKNLVTHPEQFGVQLQPIANQPYFTSVSVPNQIDAHLTAQLAEIPFEEFTALNPEYNRPVLTAAGKGSHDILLPVEAAAVFEQNLANYDKPLVSWQTYQAKPGERQEAIARKFGITLAELRDVNDLPARSTLRQPRQLLVPAGDPAQAGELAVAAMETVPAEPAAQSARRHKVAKGETLASIARHYGIGVKQLRAMNDVDPRRLRAGQVLRIEAAAVTATATASAGKATPAKLAASKVRTRYVVRRGDTLGGIARKFDVAVNDLKRWNNLRGNRIQPGDTLKILETAAA